MKKRTRVVAIAIAAVAAGALAWFAPPPSQDVASPSRSGARAASSASDGSALSALPQRAGIGKPAGEPFGPRSWVPAAPKQAAAAAPVVSAPVAPPNPYKFAAKLVQDGGARVFVSKGERIYEARVGDELDEGYRVESIGAAEIVLVYVPLGTKDRLPMDSKLLTDAPPAPAPLINASVKPGSTVAAASVTPVAASTAVAAGASSAAPEEPSVPGKPAQLRWDGPERVRAGASFDVALRLSSGEPLRATPMLVSFQPGVLEPVNVRAGKFLGQGSFSYRVNADGSIFVGASAAGAAPGSDAELLVVTFRPIKPGATAEVKLSSLSLQGAAGRAIAHEQVSTFRTAIQ